MAEENNVIRGEVAMQLLNQGKEAWNNWAKDNPDTKVDFSNMKFRNEVSFEGFLFPGKANFSNTHFLAVLISVIQNLWVVQFFLVLNLNNMRFSTMLVL